MLSPSLKSETIQTSKKFVRFDLYRCSNSYFPISAGLFSASFVSVKKFEILQQKSLRRFLLTVLWRIIDNESFSENSIKSFVCMFKLFLLRKKGKRLHFFHQVPNQWKLTRSKRFLKKQFLNIIQHGRFDPKLQKFFDWCRLSNVFSVITLFVCSVIHTIERKYLWIVRLDIKFIHSYPSINFMKVPEVRGDCKKQLISVFDLLFLDLYYIIFKQGSLVCII